MVSQASDLQAGHVGCLLFVFGWDGLDDVFPLKVRVFNGGFAEGQVSICFV